MLSRVNLSLFLIFFLLTSAARASEALSIEAGSYQLTEGDPVLCQNFTLSEKDLRKKMLSISNLYAYETRNSKYVIESDIDPQCEFREVNRRYSEQGQSVLIRTNEEFCRGKLRSGTISTLNLQGQSVVLTHQINGVSPFKCIWVKK